MLWTMAAWKMAMQTVVTPKMARAEAVAEAEVEVATARSRRGWRLGWCPPRLVPANRSLHAVQAQE